uniref:Uncharacterized protein n=1 Tax=Gopherus evgoodei TaxID=1825980 RepID=A0A8C4Y745_9SAUR
MSAYWHWRVILCKETGSCNCFVTDSQSNEGKEEDIEPQIVVSDIIQLVPLTSSRPLSCFYFCLPCMSCPHIIELYAAQGK